jgi:predicted double-glycine peptidase
MQGLPSDYRICAGAAAVRGRNSRAGCRHADIQLYSCGWKAAADIIAACRDSSLLGEFSTRMRTPAVRLKVPYYAQTLEFTCGPACLMMALKYYHPETTLNRALELALWREATLVFMTRGLGGCGPFGMASAAARRGLRALVVQSKPVVPFLYSVRTRAKREVIRLVHEQNLIESERMGVVRRYGNFDVGLIRAVLERGAVPIVLISLYRLYGSKEPHWVVVTGCDERYVYLHDPYAVLSGRGRRRNFPVDLDVFRGIRSYGRDLAKMAIALSDRTIELPENALKPLRARPAANATRHTFSLRAAHPSKPHATHGR